MISQRWIATVLMALTAAAFAQTKKGGDGGGPQNGPRGNDFEPVPAVIPVDQLPEFEVADVRVSKSTNPPRAQFLPGGRINFEGLPLKFMILAAWGYENDESRITGGPAWMNSDKYDIVAKAPPNAEIKNLRLMLRSLLIRRFGLESHMNDEPRSVYALEKGKANHKMTASEKPGDPKCDRSFDDGLLSATCHNMTMDQLAAALRGMAPAYIDRPAVNLTGLDGQFDFTLQWTPRGANGTGGGGRGAATESGPPRPDGSILSDAGPAGLTIFDSIEKNLGLKLASAKHSVPVIVVEKVNRTPLEN